MISRAVLAGSVRKYAHRDGIRYRCVQPTDFRDSDRRTSFVKNVTYKAKHTKAIYKQIKKERTYIYAISVEIQMADKSQK